MSKSDPLEPDSESQSATRITAPTATGASPPRPVDVQGGGDAGRAPALARGATLGDYEILSLLGAGAFARVYLARQLSLDRLVALKVSPNQGSEARALARLEHQHIVQVFAEIADATRNLRIVSMQFVPGLTLARLMEALRRRDPKAWSGADYLAVLDELCAETTTPLDLAGLSVRATLDTCGHAEVVCWLGARLAEALAHAHGRGIVHRDIKPANILVNRYGQPLLADFNIAGDSKTGEGTFGGTLPYMAPEHLEAIRVGDEAMHRLVDGRSDLYSLALVLVELLTGNLPCPPMTDGMDPDAYLTHLIQERKAGPPRLAPDQADDLKPLLRLLRRCLDPDPANRIQRAEEFVAAFDGCGELLRIRSKQEPNAECRKFGRTRPLIWLLTLAIIPNLVGSIVNVTYNSLVLVDENPEQRECFFWMILVYNLATYPILITLGALAIRRVSRGWSVLSEIERPISETEAHGLRKQALELPSRMVTLCRLGWFPGGVLFPLGLRWFAGPISLADSVHFFVSFGISGLIASTYAFFGIEYFVLTALYPEMWADPSATRIKARRELLIVPEQLRRHQGMAVLIPLVGAALLIGAGPEKLSLAFRVLLSSLIFLGLAGFGLATQVTQRLGHVLATWTGSR